MKRKNQKSQKQNKTKNYVENGQKIEGGDPSRGDKAKQNEIILRQFAHKVNGCVFSCKSAIKMMAEKIESKSVLQSSNLEMSTTLKTHAQEQTMPSLKKESIHKLLKKDNSQECM